ncbi:DDB1- and CUL4-associated factor 12 homolog isoform X2 [Oppia nitens]|uniref:DDB1- and CUL4-associated factor 12 homolog isoform X2 n=1 Tax=Oppia nitens TaxID=1686743 RepID=UPI0023DCEB69|nr:DDB1- and CUL4-associated factor 12 homolog isoform X2 [Oppia nitens]
MALVKKRRIDAKDNCSQYNSNYLDLDCGPNEDQSSSNQLTRSDSFTQIKRKTRHDTKDYRLLSDPKWIERFLSGEIDSLYYTSDKSQNVVDFFNSRQIDNRGLRRAAHLPQVFGTRHLLANNLLREKCFAFESFNKVFSSQWLNDQQVVLGTKCNKLIVVDVNNEKHHLIPTLKSSPNGRTPENPCGIHAIEINPSKTLLATGGLNPNDVAVYRLPTLDPFCVGENAHSDWIFDMKWLDDQFLITGSRDTKLALWRFDESECFDESESLDESETTDSLIPKHSYTRPLLVKECRNAEKIRAILYNQRQEEMVVLSLNAQIHLFDSQTLNQKFSRILPYCLENVCLTQQTDRNIYAVGSKSHVSILDTKTLTPINKVLSKSQGSGIRSLSFCNELLTIGTGDGEVLFYDIRAMKYLESINKHYSRLKASKGFVYTDEIFSDLFIQIQYSPAVYTHQYDSSKTRLFTAGGPLPASLQGSYVALWS